jgi:hypothetical protein
MSPLTKPDPWISGAPPPAVTVILVAISVIVEARVVATLVEEYTLAIFLPYFE